jgi:hypothetical protein
LKGRWGVTLAWAIVLGCAALYFVRHLGLIDLTLGVAWREAEWPAIPAPVGGLAPWLVLAGAIAGGVLLARRLRVPIPSAVTAGIGAYACLVLPAHVLELLGWVLSRPLFQPWLWALAVWGLAGLIACWPVPHEHRLPEVRTRVNDPLARWTLAAGVALACLYAESVARTIRHGARAWDSNSYHLPVPLQWLHLQSLTEALSHQVIYGRLGLEKFANPGDGHLVMTLPLAIGWDLLACLVQLPFALLAAWAVFWMAKSAGASRGAALLAAFAFAAAPIVANQAAVPVLDLATAALTLAATAILLSVAEASGPPPAAIALAGLAVGLALGTKTTAWSHLPLVALALLASSWLRTASWRTLLSRAALFATTAALPSALWYVRNAVLFGNPMYPLRIRLMGVTLIEGTTAELMSGYWEDRIGMHSRWEWLSFPFRDPVYFEESGFGPLLVCFGMLGLIMGLADLGSGLRRGGLTPRRRLTLLTLLALGIFWFAAARTPRFNLPLFGLFAALAGPALDTLGSGRRRHALGALVVALAFLTLRLSLVYHGWDMGPPETRRFKIEVDPQGTPGFVIPIAIDSLAPSVIFNDTSPETTSQASNYNLFGLDHRHLVYDHRDLSENAPAEFVSALEGLGVDYVFLRIPKKDFPPERYDTPRLEPVLQLEARDCKSTLYRLVQKPATSVARR